MGGQGISPTTQQTFQLPKFVIKLADLTQTAHWYRHAAEF